MKTNRQAYEHRHAQLCQRAERAFLEEKRKNPKLTVPKTVTAYAAAVRSLVAKRDATGYAAVLAAQAAHLVLLFMPAKSGRKGAMTSVHPIPFESNAPTQSPAGA